MWKVTLDGDKLVFTPFFDDEPKKVSVSTLYGEMVMDKVRDKFWSYNEIGKKDDEIRDLKVEYQKLRERYAQCEMDLQDRDEELQDLKLENDRLQKREELYQDFLNFLECKDRPCTRCNQYCPDTSMVCKMALPSNRHELINKLKKRLEDIG